MATPSRAAGRVSCWVGGISRRVALFLRTDIGSIDVSEPDLEGKYTLILGDLGAHLLPELGEPLRAVHRRGAHGMTAGPDIFVTPLLSADVEMRGGGLTLDGRFDYFLTPSLGLGLQLLPTAAQFTEVKVGRISREIDGLDASSGRLSLSLN